MTLYKLSKLIPLVLPLGFAMDLYLPAIPTMEKHLNTAPTTLHLTMSLFLVAFGASQIIIGPLTDRFGRKIIGIGGALLFSLSSFWCSWSTSIEELITARIFEAIGASATQVVGFTIVKETFSVKTVTSALSTLRACIGIAPVIAPVLGALILTIWDWRACFTFLGFFGLVVLAILICFIPETLAKEKQRPLAFKQLTHSFSKMLTNRHFLLNVVGNIAAQAILFGFFSVSPYLIIRELGYTESEYSHFFASNAVAMLLTGLFAGSMVRRFGSVITIQVGGLLAMIGGSLMLLCSLLFGLTLTGYLIPNILAASGVVFILGPCLAGAIAPYPNTIGAATAFAGFLEFLFGGLLGNLLIQFPLNTPIYHAILIIFSGLGILISQQLLKCTHARVTQSPSLS